MVNKKSWRNTKLWSIAFLIILSCVMLVIPALAGEGDGSGGGSNIPLGLASSTPADGQTGVALQPEIKLTFNKNVINLAIRDANKNCIALVSVVGSNVPIEVIMADDQLYPEEKRNISVKPLQALQPGTAYTLKISPQLQAKNGTSLGHEVTVKFVTAGTAAASPEPAPASPTTVEEQPNDQQTSSKTEDKSTTISDKPQTTETEKTEAETSSQVEDQPTKQSAPVTQKQTNSYANYLLAAGLILLVASGYIYFRKNNTK